MDFGTCLVQNFGWVDEACPAGWEIIYTIYDDDRDPGNYLVPARYLVPGTRYLEFSRTLDSRAPRGILNGLWPFLKPRPHL
jgi:hypothetical protein